LFLLWLLVLVFPVMLVAVAEWVDHKQKLTLEKKAELEQQAELGHRPDIVTKPDIQRPPPV